MGIIIGMDEAGYGPNLGPLVIGTTVWRVPGHPRDTDLWEALAPAVTRTVPKTDDVRLHIADSKDVYSPARGIEVLERSVLAAMQAGKTGRPESCAALRAALAPQHAPPDEGEPWFEQPDLTLPMEADEADILAAADTLQQTLRAESIELLAIRCDVVLTRRFNQLVRETDSKGVALSQTSLNLLASVWDPDEGDRVRVIADKHGGRNRYDELLEEIVGDRMIFRVEEGRERSVYRIAKTDLVFQTRAEEHLPVALASMVAKYVREVSMELFNRFWCEQIPDLRPTRGYPTDAQRFRRDIAEAVDRLGLPSDDYWRER